MTVMFRSRWRLSISIALILLALVISLAFTFASRGFTHAAAAQAASEPLIQLSSDPFHNKLSQHKTEVEPDTFAFGDTVVSAFQVGRVFNGGAADIGFATSTNGGETFTSGFLPGLTAESNPPGPYIRTSDASVAYDLKHNVWLISELGLFPGGNTSQVDVLVSRSTNGGLTWSSPVAVNATGHFNDKNWTACDDTPTSPFFGNCYTEFDNASDGDRIQMSTSTDGGLTWGPARETANHDFGIGGQPLVQPTGTVIVPIVGFTISVNQPFNQKSFISTDGGASWSATVIVSRDPIHVPQGIRATIPLPSAEIDASGKVYSVWQDCRFEKGCPFNDLVLSTTTDGLHWTAPKLVPIDPIGSHFDHFIPGLAVDRTTSGGSAHLGLAFYFFGFPGFSTGNCQTNDCVLRVGFIDSANGGQSWSKKEVLTAPMFLQWLALTTQGYMVGDYISTSIIPGDDDAFPAFAVATPPTNVPPQGGTCNSAGVVCHESIFTTSEDLLKLAGGTNVAATAPTFFPTSGTPLSSPPIAY